MKPEVLKIAIAGLLHDIGKLAERARFEVDEAYYRNNADLYQPYKSYQYRHTHRHALYTAAFIERFAGALPRVFNQAGWGDGDALINLAAGHHRPNTPMQHVITTADRLSAGIDRVEYENTDSPVPVQDYRKVRMEPLLAKVRLDGKGKFDAPGRYRLPLGPLTPEAIFPTDREIGSDEEAGQEYQSLFDGFVAELERLAHKDDPSLWISDFDSLYMRFVGQVPAATVGSVVPDVSLYDHSRATAALATALYLYHVAEGNLTPEAIQDGKPRKFLLLRGNFYGIQQYIFSEGGSTNRAAAKILRGRSFSVSLLCELAAAMVCRECGVSPLSVLLSAAGKFTILLPNTQSAREGIARIEKRVDEWFFSRYYGEAGIGFSIVDASHEDFLHDRIESLWERLSDAQERRKYRKIPLDEYGGAVLNFDSTRGICSYCGKRPAEPEAMKPAGNEDAVPCCSTCKDQIVIGQKLVECRIVSIFDDPKTENGVLLSPPFGVFQLIFGSKPNGQGEIVSWDIAPWREPDRDGERVGVKPIGGYVPKFVKGDENDARLSHGERSDRKVEELKKMVSEGAAKTFHHIAKQALRLDEEGRLHGVEAIAALKADIDNLGRIFAEGIPGKPNLSRTAGISRQVNNFFCYYIPWLLSTDGRFSDVYTIFAGGDDLFLVGPWNTMLDLAEYLRASFRRYACDNPDVTLSAAVEPCKPGMPVRYLAKNVERGLEKAKSASPTKDHVTVFGETVTWEKYRELREIGARMEKWIDDGTANSAMLYRFNTLIPMIRQEEAIRRTGGNVPIRDAECMMWRARLRYSIVRNAGKGSFPSTEKAVEELMRSVGWLTEYGGRFIIALWPVLYNNR